jgi:hypothetical protein
VVGVEADLGRLRTQVALLGPSASSVAAAAATATTQASWFIDRVNGSSTASGLDDANPVDSAATIRSRWTGGIAGARPQIGDVATITITWLTEAAVQPDVSDPIAVLLDVDFSTHTTMILRLNTSTVVLSGTLASASSFARTASQGQILITDAAVSDFSPFAPGLFHDITTGAVAWLYEPKTTEPTGLVTKGKTPRTAGVQALTTDAPINAGDSYEILAFPRVYFGADSLTRQFPSAGPNGAEAKIFIYRLHDSTQGGGSFGDTWRPQTSGCAKNGSGVTILLQECLIEQGWQVAQGLVFFYNCGHASAVADSGAIGRTDVILDAGFAYQGFEADGSSVIKVAGDFLLDGNAVLEASNGGLLFIESFSRWGTTGPAINILGGRAHIQSITGGPVVTYGTVGAGNPVVGFFRDDVPGQLHIQGIGTAVAKMQWDSNVTNWAFPVASSGNSGWGFNQATGHYAGTADGVPCANTWAHLDAALNAPGFGAACIDPASGCLVHEN